MQIEPVKRKSLKAGLITESVIADSDYPVDACYESLNFNFDSIGKARLRLGSTQIGQTLAASAMLGLYNFRDSGAGANNQLVCVNGTVLYYLSTNTWTSKRTTLTGGSKADFTTFLDFLWMANGTEATAIWDGNPSNSFLTTGNALNAPTGKYIENYRSRVWIAGNSSFPDRVYYSSIPTAAATPVVTWNTDNVTGWWIDISPSDGDNITCLFRSKVALLCFKQNHIYNIFATTSVDPDPLINVGTWSKQSVVEAKTGVYFHHPTGFYQYANGAVQEISQPINDIVKAITMTNYSKISGWIEPDGNHICWSVGSVTIQGNTFSNLVVRYTISTQIWTHYSYPYQFICSTVYNTGTTMYSVTGDTAGKTYVMDLGKTDNGSAISYSLIHPFDTIDGYESTVKNITKMFFSHTGGNGTSVTYQTNEDNHNDWTKGVCQLGQYDTGVLNANVKGRKLHFKLSGSSTGEPFYYEGMEILAGESSFVTFT